MAVKMSNLRKDYEHIPEVPTYRLVSVTICTCSPRRNVHEFMDELATSLDETVKEVRYQQLPYSDIENFSFSDKDIDVMILCHSINNRRFAVTDVPDALYTKFLIKAARGLGKEKVGVIVHDMPNDDIVSNDQHRSHMMSFRHRQPTTFHNASLVVISGRLDSSPIQLGPGTWTAIREFLAKASRLSEEPPARALRKRFLPALIIFAVIAGIALVLGLSIGFSVSSTGSPTGTSTPASMTPLDILTNVSSSTPT